MLYGRLLWGNELSGCKFRSIWCFTTPSMCLPVSSEQDTHTRTLPCRLLLGVCSCFMWEFSISNDALIPFKTVLGNKKKEVCLLLYCWYRVTDKKRNISPHLLWMVWWMPTEGAGGTWRRQS
jgi:hypothetical protein